jgi:hypothetical protein
MADMPRARVMCAAEFAASLAPERRGRRATKSGSRKSGGRKGSDHKGRPA